MSSGAPSMFGAVQSKFNTMEECLCGTLKPLPSSPIPGSLAGILALKTSELHEVNKDTSFTNINDVGEFCHNHAHPHTHTPTHAYVCMKYAMFATVYVHTYVSSYSSSLPLYSLSLLCYPPISYSFPTSPSLFVYFSPFSFLTYSYIFPTSLPPHLLTSPSVPSHLTISFTTSHSALPYFPRYHCISYLCV